MFMKLKISSIKDILPLLSLIFPVVKAGDKPFLHSSDWISLSHRDPKGQNPVVVPMPEASVE